MCINEVLEAGRCADNMFFDSLDMVCDFFEYVTCYEPDYEIVETTTNPPVVTTPKAPEEIPIPDSQCPPRGSTEIIFLPSKNCNEYYICHNGLPNLFFCRPGTHWNANEQFCDLPSNAGCTVSIFALQKCD